MDNDVKKHLFNSSTWGRGLIMLIFVFLLYGLIAELFTNGVLMVVVAAVVLFQFGFMLFTGQPNTRLLAFGESLGIYIYQVIRYLTYNTEEKPFPFRSWPNVTEAPVESKPAARPAPKPTPRPAAQPAQRPETIVREDDDNTPAN